MNKLTGAQKKHLRGLAHGLKPVGQVGKQGLTPSLMESLDQALASHELVKVRFVDLKDQKREACEMIAARLGSAQVGIIGHVAIFYRPARDPEDRKIRLPD
ncbi:MAG: YhbY family RNA-binding protein [bacterium]|nr:YhbY family RNA-binding protein [bacterium]